jgi:serine/threonine protein kinase
MTGRVGQHLGNYRLLRLLGHGGFADVYLGEHIHLQTLTALKLLHTQLSDEETPTLPDRGSHPGPPQPSAYCART